MNINEFNSGLKEALDKTKLRELQHKYNQAVEDVAKRFDPKLVKLLYNAHEHSTTFVEIATDTPLAIVRLSTWLSEVQVMVSQPPGFAETFPAMEVDGKRATLNPLESAPKDGTYIIASIREM